MLTFPEAIDEIARAAGREVRYKQVSPEQYASLLAEQNVPAKFVSLMNYLFTEVLDGRNAHLTDRVQRALGRPPRDFADYARGGGHWDMGRRASTSRAPLIRRSWQRHC